MRVLRAFGDGAVRFAIPGDISRAALLARLREAGAVVDAVLAEDVGMVTFATPADRPAAEEAVRAALDAHDTETPRSARTHLVEVVYDGEDLEDVARATGLTRAGVVEAHAGATYEVAMLGFLPGFAYLRGLDARLALPRRSSPRTRVPRASLAIAAEYTGIYPFASAGGWHLLGRATRFEPFSPERGAAFALGDRVRLVPVADVQREAARAGEEPPPAADAALEVVRALGPVLVVDGGRPGHMHEGVPPGGPLVPRGLARANGAVGNAPATAALEVHGTIEVRALASVVLADDTGRVHALQRGDVLTLATARRARAVYLAVRGGIDVPVVLGSRCTLLVAGTGGFHGRVLRRGDRLAIGDAPVAAPAPLEAPAPDVAVDLLPGPDADEPALAALTSSRFRISASSDRTGTRLEGEVPAPSSAASGAAARRSSTPMVRGAVQRTPHGFIVLGPDHPTTGGYPVVAVVASHAESAFTSRPPLSEVTFRIDARARSGSGS